MDTHDESKTTAQPAEAGLVLGQTAHGVEGSCLQSQPLKGKGERKSEPTAGTEDAHGAGDAVAAYALDVAKIPAADVRGTWDQSVFQLYLGPRPAQFHIIGIHCSPHVGVYGDEYMPREEVVHVTLPVNPASLHKQLPDGLREKVRLVPSTVSEVEWTMPTMFGAAEVAAVDVEPSQLQLLVVVHGWERFMPCGHMSCFKTDEVNLMWHTWAFQDAFFSGDLSVKTVLACGAFDVHGLGTCHTELMDGGLDFNVLSKRSQSIHSAHFSPQNVQVRLLESHEVASFVTAAFTRQQVDAPDEVLATPPTAEDGDGAGAGAGAADGGDSSSEDSVPPTFYRTRGIITLHLVAITQVAESRLRYACTKAKSLRTLQARLAKLAEKHGEDYVHAAAKVDRMLAPYARQIVAVNKTTRQVVDDPVVVMAARSEEARIGAGARVAADADMGR